MEMRRGIRLALFIVATLFVLVSHADSQWSQAKITSRQLTPPWVSTITATASYDNRHIAIDQKGNHWLYLIGDQTWYWRASDFPTDVIDAEWPTANTLVVLRSNGKLRAYRWPERSIQWEVDVQGTNRLTYNYGRYVCYSTEQVKVVHPTTLAVETTSWSVSVVAASYGPKGTIVLLRDGTLNVVQGESMETTSVTMEVPVLSGGIRGNIVAFASNLEMGTIRIMNDEVDTIQIIYLPTGVSIEQDEMFVSDSGTAVGTLVYDNTKYPLIIDNDRRYRQNTWLRGDLRIPRAVTPRYVMLSWGYIFIVGNDASIRRLGYNTIEESWVLNYQSLPKSNVTVLDRVEREDGRLVSLLKCPPPYQPWESQSTSALLRHSNVDSLESWTVVPTQFADGGRILAITDEQAILTSSSQTLAIDLRGVVTSLFSDDPRCEHFRRFNNKLYSLYKPAIVSTNYGTTWDTLAVSIGNTIGGFFITDSMWAVKTLVDGKPGTSTWYIKRPQGEFVPVHGAMSPVGFYTDLRQGERCLVIDWSVPTGVTHGFYSFIERDSLGALRNRFEAEKVVSDPLFKVHVDVLRRPNETIIFDVDRAVNPTRMRVATYDIDGSSSYDVIGLPVMERARVAYASKPHPLVIVITFDDGTEFTYDLRNVSSTQYETSPERSEVIRLTEDSQSLEIFADVTDVHLVDYVGQSVMFTMQRYGNVTRITFSSPLRRGLYAVSFMSAQGERQSSVFMSP